MVLGKLSEPGFTEFVEFSEFKFRKFPSFRGVAAKQTGCAPKARDVLLILLILLIGVLCSCTEPQFDNPFDGDGKSYSSSSEEQSSSSSEELSSSSSEELSSSSGDGENSSSSSYIAGLFCDASSVIGKVGQRVPKPKVWCNGELLDSSDVQWGTNLVWNEPILGDYYGVRATVTNGNKCKEDSKECGTLRVGKGDGAEVVGFDKDNEYNITSKSVKVKYSSLNPSTGQEVEYCNKTDKDCDNDENWQLGGLFDKLSPGKEYEIKARAKENDNYKAGNITESIFVSTLSVSCNVAGTANITSSSSTEIDSPGSVMCGEKKVDTKDIKWIGINLEEPAVGNYTKIQAEITNGLCKDETVTCTGTFTVKYLCDDKEYDPKTHFCDNDEKIAELCEGEKYDKEERFCYNRSTVGDFCGDNPQKSYDPEKYGCKEGSNGIYLKESINYGNENYEAVLIGEQVWMAENLNYEPSSSDEIATNSKCYDNNSDNCEIYGRLYDWATAMALPVGCNINYPEDDCAIKTPYHKGICPEGWHIPTALDWSKLLGFVDGITETGDNFYNSKAVANYLKATHSWTSQTGTDDYGFAALPGSYHEVGSNTYFNYSYWWSSHSISMTTIAGSYYIALSSPDVTYGEPSKGYFLGVRCVKDD